jgi:DNA adenine methylase
MRSRVLFIENQPWQTTLAKCAELGLAEAEMFFYLDPPFYHKADRLYQYYFRDQDHVQLRDSLRALRSPWFLSYDPSDFITDLYTQNGTSKHVEVLYTAGGSGRSARSEVVVTNLGVLPVEPNSRMVRSPAR